MKSNAADWAAKSGRIGEHIGACPQCAKHLHTDEACDVGKKLVDDLVEAADAWLAEQALIPGGDT